MSKHAHRVVVYRVAILATLLVAGCSTGVSPDTRRASVEKMSALDPEDARYALVRMVEESSDALLRAGLGHLKTDKVEALDGTRVTIGKWQIDLSERVFVLSLVKEPRFHSYRGIFERPTDGNWKATIIEERRTCEGPPRLFLNSK